MLVKNEEASKHINTIQYNTISFIEDDKTKDSWHSRNWDLLHDGY